MNSPGKRSSSTPKTQQALSGAVRKGKCFLAQELTEELG